MKKYAPLGLQVLSSISILGCLMIVVKSSSIYVQFFFGALIFVALLIMIVQTKSPGYYEKNWKYFVQSGLLWLAGALLALAFNGYDKSPGFIYFQITAGVISALALQRLLLLYFKMKESLKD